MPRISSRWVEEMTARSLAVIDEAYRRFPDMTTYPLFSGGYDSYSACKIASMHRSFEGMVYHINTGIGSQATKEYVNLVCEREGWRLWVMKSPTTYEDIVRSYGFPGPPGHQWAYSALKDRCIRVLVKHPEGRKSALITGCRSQESARRMGHVEAIKIGVPTKTGKPAELNKVWVAPCHDWSSEQQRVFLDHHDVPVNPVKDSILGMSGECFCGAFAQPNELEMIREVCPDVAAEIDRLTEVAKAAGKPCVWGSKKPVNPGGGLPMVDTIETGPLCTSCDQRLAAARLIVEPITESPEEDVI